MMTSDFGTSLSPIASFARDDPRAIDLDAGDAARRRARRDDDLLASSGLLLALDDVHLPLAGQDVPSLDPVDLVLLERGIDPPGEAGDDAILARLDLVHVDRGAAEGSVTPHSFASRITLSACACSSSAFVGMQPKSAGAPSASASRQRQLFSELRAADCGDVPTGTGADDHQS